MYQSYTHPSFNWQPGPSEARFSPQQEQQLEKLQLQADPPKKPEKPKNLKVEEKVGRLHLSWEDTDKVNITVFSGEKCDKDGGECVTLKDYSDKTIELCDIRGKTKYTVQMQNCKDGVCSDVLTTIITTKDPCADCKTDTDCTDCENKPKCNEGNCVECTSASQCAKDGKVCEKNICVECTENDQCKAYGTNTFICEKGKCILKPIQWGLILGTIGGLVALFFFLIILTAIIMKSH